jgi:hypothetical protein
MSASTTRPSGRSKRSMTLGPSLPPPRQQDAKGGENLAALTTGPEMVVVAEPTIPCDRRKKMALRLSPVKPEEENDRERHIAVLRTLAA